ncbi:MAG TPA: 50S ribosomal protein L25 [Tepidisphaeraceae bacterium]|jgi:large subunit ribosomal protein L25|nr:50S ribosomal protein L25 [Tepidisphaeraceae bacterium]
MASKTAQVSAETRTALGSRANKRLRDAGKLPGVIYGHKEAILPVTLPKKEVAGHINHGQHLFDIAIDGKSEKVLIKEVQYDHLGIDLIHVDFARVSLDEKVTLTVSIETKGEPKSDTGVLQQIMNEIEIECLVTDIPDVIKVSVGDMQLDDVIHVKDLKLPQGVVALADEDQIVVQLKEITDSEDAAEADAAEPEVIGKAKEDGDADAEEAK